MKKIKRILASLMVAVMVLTAAPLSGFVGLELPNFWKLFSTEAEAATYSGTCGDNLTWSLDTNKGELVISGTGAMYDYNYDGGPWCWKYDYLIRTVIIGNNVTSIGLGAFSGCYHLLNLVIGDRVQSIGPSAFADCNDLTKATIPDSVTSIGIHAFDDCESLADVTIGNGVTNIGLGAFFNCNSLASVTIPSCVQNIGKDAFGYCFGLKKIIVDAANEKYSSDQDGVLFNKDKSELVAYPAGKTETSYSVPNGVTRIGEDAFLYCENIVSIVIPDSVTSIGDRAFNGCTSLVDITISKNVTSIEYGAFLSCSSLSVVYYTGTETQWEKIDIDGCNDALLKTYIDFNYIILKDGLNIITSKSTLTYLKDDFILFAATIAADDILSIPTSLSVNFNNANVVSLIGMYDYKALINSSYASLFKTFPEELKSCTFVVLKAKDEGTSVVTFTDNLTGEYFSTMVSVFTDEFASLRADNVPVKYDRGEAYNYYLNGLVVSDFDYSKADGGYIFTFNCYNQMYSLGVVEVYEVNDNNEAKIIKTEKIDKFSSGGSILGAFQDGWNLVKSFYYGEAMTFKGSQIAKCTPVEIFVPENGFIRITNDSAVSTTCFVVNLFDAIMTAGGIIDNTNSLAPEQIDDVDKVVLEKFSSDSYYLEIAKIFQEDMVKMLMKETTESALLSLISQAGSIAKEILMGIGDLTVKDICDEALGTSAGICETIFEKVSGPAGLALSVAFSGQKVLDYITQMQNWYITTNKESFIGILPPFSYGSTSNELSSPDGIKVETNDNVEPEVILQTYRVLNSGIDIELGSGKVINDPTLYNIALVKGGKEVQPNGKVRVHIPVPEGYGEDITVLRQNDDGSWEIITNETVENGIISFDVSHFCLFAIVDKNVGTDDKISGKCGDNLTWTFDESTGELIISGMGDMYENGDEWNEYRDSIVAVRIENGVTSIIDYAFSGYANLVDIVIPDSVTKIGRQICRDTPFYENQANWENGSLYIGNHLIETKYNFFGICTIKEGTKTIASSAFYDCYDLTGVIIPESVIGIGDTAFYFCYILEQVSIPKNVLKIGDDAFGYCDVLQYINVDVHNPYYSSVDGVLYNKNRTELICYPMGKTEESFVVPNGVKVIKKSAFELCKLKSIIIADSVTVIESGAFANCENLKSIVLSKNISKIEECAFIYSSAITDIYYNNTKDAWNKIEISYLNDPLFNATIHFAGKVHSISIDDISMSYKDSATISPAIYADSGVKYTVSYSSSDDSVVSVDQNGKITTRDTGSATITVTVTDEYGNTVSDTCNVEVKYTWWQWIIVIVLFGWIWY